MGPTQTIRNNLPISGSLVLISPAKPLLPSKRTHSGIPGMWAGSSLGGRYSAATASAHDINEGPGAVRVHRAQSEAQMGVHSAQMPQVPQPRGLPERHVAFCVSRPGVMTFRGGQRGQGGRWEGEGPRRTWCPHPPHFRR